MCVHSEGLTTVQHLVFVVFIILLRYGVAGLISTTLSAFPIIFTHVETSQKTSRIQNVDLTSFELKKLCFQCSTMDILALCVLKWKTRNESPQSRIQHSPRRSFCRYHENSNSTAQKRFVQTILRLSGGFGSSGDNIGGFNRDSSDSEGRGVGREYRKRDAGPGGGDRRWRGGRSGS